MPAMTCEDTVRESRTEGQLSPEHSRPTPTWFLLGSPWVPRRSAAGDQVPTVKPTPAPPVLPSTHARAYPVRKLDARLRFDSLSSRPVLQPQQGIGEDLMRLVKNLFRAAALGVVLSGVAGATARAQTVAGQL